MALDIKRPILKRKRGLLFIVSAPSGAGKTTLCQRAVDYFGNVRHSVSYTTRAPRDGERDGFDYHFIDEGIFHEMVGKNEFLEYAEVHGNMYGTSIKDTQLLLEKGYDVALDIDVQGARKIREKAVNGISIFVLPPNMDICRERLEKRGVNSKDEIDRRIENAKKEIREVRYYDYILINNYLDDAFEIFKAIIIAERAKKEQMLPEVLKTFGDIIEKKREV